MNLKKISAFILSSFLSVNSFIFTFAEERKVLTVEEAVNQALKYSKTLKSYDEDNEINDIEIKQAKQNLVSSGEVDQIASFAVKLKELYAKVEANKLSADKERENIEYSVFSFFIDIIKAENNIKLYDEEVKLKQKQLKISEAKVKYGRMSKNDYETQVIEYKNLLKQKDDLQTNIDNAYTSLNKVLGNDLNTKYDLNLGEEITYNSIGNVSESELESVITMAIDRSNIIKSQKSTVDIAKYNLNTFTRGTSTDNKELKTNNYNKALRSLEDEKTALRESIIKNYNEIIKNENEYKSNIIELENMKNQLEIKKLNFKIGKVTQIEIEEYEYEIKKLENTIKEQTYDHELIMRKYENPALF